ncbi:MAG: hypothetical protein ACPIOQ_09630 [Promethearchaeia archaeon]
MYVATQRALSARPLNAGPLVEHVASDNVGEPTAPPVLRPGRRRELLVDSESGALKPGPWRRAGSDRPVLRCRRADAGMRDSVPCCRPPCRPEELRRACNGCSGEPPGGHAAVRSCGSVAYSAAGAHTAWLFTGVAWE